MTARRRYPHNERGAPGVYCQRCSGATLYCDRCRRLWCPAHEPAPHLSRYAVRGVVPSNRRAP